jgi:hypothetical protein
MESETRGAAEREREREEGRRRKRDRTDFLPFALRQLGGHTLLSLIGCLLLFSSTVTSNCFAKIPIICNNNKICIICTALMEL